MEQYPYPIGPLSLVQLESGAATRRYQLIHGWIDESKDAYDVGMESQVKRGLYPTFGHIDNKTRRWYRDFWGPCEVEIGIPIPS